ncbi:hypothetical protein CISIN_1g042808mg, partial [Citrus sinensis]
MVDAIVSPLLELLICFAVEVVKQQVKLVVGVKQEVKKLTSHLQAIQDVLNDAEQRQVKEEFVRLWLGRIKDISYDIEDVLDEWITNQGDADDNVVVLAPQKKKKECSYFLATCFGFKQVFIRHDIAIKIKEINEEVDDIATQKNMFKFVES